MDDYLVDYNSNDESQGNNQDNNFSHFDDDSLPPNEPYHLDAAFLDEVKYGNLTMAQHYLDQGADVHYKGDEAIVEAARHGYLEMVKLLVKYDANISARHDLPFRDAAMYNHFNVVKYLVKKGANAGAVGNDAFLWSAQNGNLEMLKYFENHGVDIHTHRDQALVLSSREGHFKVVEYLIEHGARIDPIALCLAAANGHLRVVRFLVKNGADIHYEKDYAMKYALMNNYEEVAEYLVAQDFDYYLNHPKFREYTGELLTTLDLIERIRPPLKRSGVEIPYEKLLANEYIDLLYPEELGKSWKKRKLTSP